MGESARYPAEVLLGELRACTERFATFLDLIVQTAPQFAKRSEWLHAALAKGSAVGCVRWKVGSTFAPSIP
jgi:hypothetical protein